MSSTSSLKKQVTSMHNILTTAVFLVTLLFIAFAIVQSQNTTSTRVDYSATEEVVEQQDSSFEVSNQ